MNEYQKLIADPNDRADLCVELTAVRITELIAKHLEERNISRAEFARLMDVTPGRVTQILDPDSNLQVRTIARALAVLGLVMSVEAVTLESLACPEKWEEASCVTSAFVQRPSAATATKASERPYALAA